MAIPSYKSVKNSPSTAYFGMNEVACLVFGHEGKRYHLTDALNACFGVFLISPLATISAHLPPHPGSNFVDPQAGDKNIIAKMQEFVGLYQKYEKYFMNYNVALVYAKFHGKSPMPDKKEFIEKCLRKLKVDFPVQDYDVKSPGEPRRDEHGTAFVDGQGPSGAILYVEDKPIMRVSRPAPSDSDPLAVPQQPPAQDSYPGAIFPRTVAPATPANISDIGQSSQVDKVAKTTSAEQLRHVKSRPDDKGKGGRLVETAQGEILIKAEEWEKANMKGKTVLICRRYKLLTDV